MKKALLLALICGLGWNNACSQRPTVEGMKDYIEPKYLVIQDMSSDPLNARGLVWGEMQRAGYHVISPGQAQALLNQESDELAVGDVFSKTRLDSMPEDELKDALKEQGLYWIPDGRKLVDERVKQGDLIQWTVEEEVPSYIPNRTRTVSTTYYAWADNRPFPESKLTLPHTFHLLSMTYTYRESLSCGNTFSQFHGTVNEISNGTNVSLVDFEFNQPMLGSSCPRQIIAALGNQMKPPSRPEETQPAEVDVVWSENQAALSDIGTVTIVGQPGADCQGTKSEEAVDHLALGLIATYDVVDRSVLQLAFDEQQLSMSGLVRESDLVEAGQLAGAQGIITVQASCLASTSIWKAKLISTESSLLLMTAIGRDVTALDLADEIARTLND